MYEMNDGEMNPLTMLAQIYTVSDILDRLYSLYKSFISVTETIIEQLKVKFVNFHQSLYVIVTKNLKIFLCNFCIRNFAMILVVPNFFKPLPMVQITCKL